jgi:D-alanyl-D-alanine carboxypeptidase (penicillin-binding protein 5/6)
MFNKFLSFINKHKRTVLAIIIALVVVAVVKNYLSEKKVTGSIIIQLKNSHREIEENIEKYQPKYDWVRTHPSNITLTAKSAIIIDQNTGQILLTKNEHEKLPPASITKILTLVTVLEGLKIDKLCSVSEKAASIQPNKITMNVGEKMKVEGLLYGLMMISANDAAEVLAECYDGGRDKFIAKMNEKVKLLGLKDSIFKDPHGLNDIDELSSAFDMGTITRYALLEHPETLKYIGRKEDYNIYPTDHNGSHSWYQISNLLLTYPGMEGAKTGYTHIAKNSYIGVARRSERRVIIVYLGAETTTSDATTLLNYGFSVNPNM